MKNRSRSTRTILLLLLSLCSTAMHAQYVRINQHALFNGSSSLSVPNSVAPSSGVQGTPREQLDDLRAPSSLPDVLGVEGPPSASSKTE